jgi:hypothetical protein
MAPSKRHCNAKTPAADAAAAAAAAAFDPKKKNPVPSSLSCPSPFGAGTGKGEEAALRRDARTPAASSRLRLGNPPASASSSRANNEAKDS